MHSTLERDLDVFYILPNPPIDVSPENFESLEMFARPFPVPLRPAHISAARDSSQLWARGRQPARADGGGDRRSRVLIERAQG